MNLEYSEAVGQVLQILKHTEKILIDKIPKKLLEFWERNAVINSELDIEENQKIEQMNLKPKSKALIGMIYRNYWCNAEERKEYDQILKQNEEKFQEEARKKYNPEEIFKYQEKSFSGSTEISEEQKSNIILYKENIFTKIIQKIKRILKMD